jgi:hypothetical protein
MRLAAWGVREFGFRDTFESSSGRFPPTISIIEQTAA